MTSSSDAATALFKSAVKGERRSLGKLLTAIERGGDQAEIIAGLDDKRGYVCAKNLFFYLDRSPACLRQQLPNYLKELHAFIVPEADICVSSVLCVSRIRSNMILRDVK